jgi:glycosyltransferase 2 family protein
MEKRSFWRDAGRWIPGVLISMVALFVVIRLANWKDLGLAFSNIRPLNLSIAVALSVASLGTRAMAWRTLLEDRPSFRQSFFIINEGYLLNNLFPLRAGEIGRAVFMGKATGLSPLHILSTIVIERAFDLAMAAALLLSTLPLALQMDWAKPFALVTILLVCIGLLALFLIARYHLWVQAWVKRMGARWPFVQRRILPYIDSLLDGLAVLTQPSRFLWSLFWIFLSWVGWVVTHYVILITIAPNVPFWWAPFADSVLALGVAVPSAPAALGVFEASLVGALSILGVSASTGLAYAILMHFLGFSTTGLFGIIGLFMEGRSLGTIFAEIRSTK